MFVSKNGCGAVANSIANFLGCKSISLDSKHLRYPLLLTQGKTMDFDFLKEKLESKLNSWKSKCLFRDGRATLIKASA